MKNVRGKKRMFQVLLMASLFLVLAAPAMAGINEPPTVFVTSPYQGEVVVDPDPLADNALIVTGSVQDVDENLSHYTVEIAPGANPMEEEYSLLNTHYYPVSASTAGLWVYDGWDEPYKPFMTVLSEDTDRYSSIRMGIDVHEGPISIGGQTRYGVVYVGDHSKQVIWAFDFDGNELLQIGEPGQGDGQIDDPKDLFLVGDDLYVLCRSDTSTKRDLQKFDAATGAYKNWRIDLNGFAEVPQYATYSQETKTFFVAFPRASGGQTVIREFTQQGRLVNEFGHDTVSSYMGIAIGADNIIYAADSILRCIKKFDLDGELIENIPTQCNIIVDMDVDADLNMAISCRSDHSIYLYSPAGQRIGIMTGYPWITSVNFDAFGNLFATGNPLTLPGYYTYDVTTSDAELSAAPAGTYTLRVIAEDDKGAQAQQTVTFDLVK